MTLRLCLLGGAIALAVIGFLYVRHLQSEVSHQRDALRRAATALNVAAVEIKSRDDKIKLISDHEAQDATATASFWKGQSLAAFKAGYASRNCAGAQPDGVRDDLRTIWEAGAFHAQPDPRPMPGKPHG